MKDSNSIYSFSLGAIIANIGFPIEQLTQTDIILLLIFICKTMLAGFLSVLSTDMFKKLKTWLIIFLIKMANSTKIVIGLSLVAATVVAAIKGYSFYNKTKNAINQVQFLFSFVRVQGLIGEGITKYTNPVLQVIFLLKINNLSNFNIEAKNIVATIQKFGATWNTIGIIDKPYVFLNVPAKGGSTNVQLPINFTGLATLQSIANVSSKYRVVVTYEYKGTALEFIQEIPLQQYIKLAIDNIKKSLGLKGFEQKNTLALAG